MCPPAQLEIGEKRQVAKRSLGTHIRNRNQTPYEGRIHLPSYRRASRSRLGDRISTKIEGISSRVSLNTWLRFDKCYYSRYDIQNIQKVKLDF